MNIMLLSFLKVYFFFISLECDLALDDFHPSFFVKDPRSQRTQKIRVQEPAFILPVIKSSVRSTLKHNGLESSSNRYALPRIRRASFGSLLWGFLCGGFAWLMGLHSSYASPFDPRPIPRSVSNPFFEGWFLRTVDHTRNMSFSLIIGSLKAPGATNFTEHYVSLSYLDQHGDTHTFHAFPSLESVEILVDGDAVRSLPAVRKDSSFIWKSSEVGELCINGSQGSMNFSLPTISVCATFHDRKPWSKVRPNEDGPEGWLSKTWLLPCHYFVYSLASATSYSIEIHKDKENPGQVVKGSGFTHLESNYGDTFPTGWAWAQGISQNREAQLILTGGRFVIGPFTTNTWVIGFRSSKHQLNFRSTDLGRIKSWFSCQEKRLCIEATSPLHQKCRFEVDISVDNQKKFGSPIYFPTRSGFSNNPGCIESYAALMAIRIFVNNKIDEHYVIPLCALEFGGEFQFS